jgi:hypothetical protein
MHQLIDATTKRAGLASRLALPVVQNKSPTLARNGSRRASGRAILDRVLSGCDANQAIPKRRAICSNIFCIDNPWLRLEGRVPNGTENVDPRASIC